MLIKTFPKRKVNHYLRMRNSNIWISAKVIKVHMVDLFFVKRYLSVKPSTKRLIQYKKDRVSYKTICKILTMFIYCDFILCYCNCFYYLIKMWRRLLLVSVLCIIASNVSFKYKYLNRYIIENKYIIIFKIKYL